jgi:hypothetical protein
VRGWCIEKGLWLYRAYLWCRKPPVRYTPNPPGGNVAAARH